MITVEDFNSVLREYGAINIYPTIDTGLISEEYDFEDIKYDFCIVSRETLSENNYRYRFDVKNDAWTGGYWITDNEGNYVSDVNVTYSAGVITILTELSSIVLHLYLFAFARDFKFERYNWILHDIKSIKCIKTVCYRSAFYYIPSNKFFIEKLNPDYELDNIRFFHADSGFAVYAPIFEQGNLYSFEITNYPVSNTRICHFQNNLSYGDLNKIFFYVDLVAQPELLYFNTTTLFNGAENHISVEGCLSNISGVVTYANNEIPFTIRDGFDIDLKGLELESLNIKIDLYTYYWFKGWSYEFTFNCINYSVNNVGDFIRQLSDDGADLFKLNSDITLSEDVVIEHDVKIMGENHSIDLNGHSIIVSDGISFKLSDCSLSRGDNAIVQKIGSDVELENVIFRNCLSTEYDNLGSCLYCLIDSDSLLVEDDFKSSLKNCEFYDNHSAVFHGGVLTMSGCKLHNTDLDYMDTHNVAFVYQTDGRCIVRDSIMDIDYSSSSLCENEESVGFAQALFKCGETATINGAGYSVLQSNNAFPIGFENRYHLFCLYYHTASGECVYSSPVIDKEDKALCYCVTGVNRLFRSNVKITRYGEDLENRYNPIEW